MKFWIKLWIDTLHDPKMGALSDRLWRRTIECFMMAGEKNEEGYLPTLAEMSWELRMVPEELEADLVHLEEISILNRIDGRWFVNKFAERQAPLNSSQRSKQHRIRNRRKHYQGTLWDGNRDEVATFRPTEEKRGEEKDRREEKESAVTFRDADEMAKCPKCSIVIYEHALELDCAAHMTYQDLKTIAQEEPSD